MNHPIDLEKLKPSDIVDVKMDSNRIFHIDVRHPILNADVDYEVAVHIDEELKKLEAIHGKATGMLIDITNYNRLDCPELFGMTVPATKTRKVHANASKKGIFKRVAFCRKNTSRAIEFCVEMISLSCSKKKTRVFSDKTQALNWLEEGVQELHNTGVLVGKPKLRHHEERSRSCKA